MSTTRTAWMPALTRPAAYWALTKPDVTFLVVLTTFAGFYLGSRGPVDLVRLVHAVVGTALVAAGTSALNQYLERNQDAQMRRTAARPLPSGLLSPNEARWFGIGLAAAGVLDLVVAAGALAGGLAFLTCVTYLGAYTPLKKRTTLATLVGAFPGAAPPLIGWAAARGTISFDAAVLYAILFFWQFPHFLAIAWMYREDYARAGIQMLPVVDGSGTRTFRQILLTAMVSVPIGLLPGVTGLAGTKYLFGALVLSLALVQICLWAGRSKTNRRAKWLMHTTVLFLPLQLGLMMWNKTIR